MRTQLTAEECRPFLSPYLMGGYRQDAIELLSATIDTDGRLASAEYRLTQFYLAADGRFHLPAPIAFIAVAQTAIIYACVANRLASKIGEVYLHRITLACKATVDSPTPIKVVVREHSSRRVGKSVVYKGDFRINTGEFSGTASFICPLEAP